VIQKWSVTHLGGIDLTSLGPPAKRKGLETSTGPQIQNIDKSIDSIKETVDSIDKDIGSSTVESTLSNKRSDTKKLKSDDKHIMGKDEEISSKPEIQNELIGDGKAILGNIKDMYNNKEKQT
jgi:hypothetical protein